MEIINTRTDFDALFCTLKVRCMALEPNFAVVFDGLQVSDLNLRVHIGCTY
jgi:hypothetical protein